MKVVPFADGTARASEIAQVLRDGGLACFSLRGTYRIAADLGSLDAVNRLLQSKRRVRHRPTLVAVGDTASAKRVVDGMQWDITKKLAAKFWPGPLTLVLPPSEELAPKMRAVLAKATGKVGVRMPADPLAGAILRAFGGPLLLSSANIEQKPGASSAAGVRQKFSRSIDIWVDAGDVPPAPPSTIVEVDATSWKLVRAGAISEEELGRVIAKR